MRPEHLKSPFSWEERRVLIKDRVWFVPHYYDRYSEFTFPGWTHPEVFGNENPICVEYCSGNGSWIAERAANDPLTNWVAIEKKFERARKIWSKIKNLNLRNLLVVCGEGYTVTSQYFPSESISSIAINFPDPWPKNRHTKHRLIQQPFIQEMHRCLKKDGSTTFVTDDADYSDWTIRMMLESKRFDSCHPEPFYVTEHSQYGTSFFDQLWRELGRNIRYHCFRKKGT